MRTCSAGAPRPCRRPHRVSESAAGTFNDLGPGCCAGDRTAAAGVLFEGTGYSLGSCKTKCVELGHCGFLEYGWNDGLLRCVLWADDAACSSLRTGASDCGPGGGDTGVHAYVYMTREGMGVGGRGTGVVNEVRGRRAGMHCKGRGLRGGPRSGYVGGRRRLPKRLGAVTVGCKCH